MPSPTAELRLTAKDETRAAFDSAIAGMNRVGDAGQRLKSVLGDALGAVGLGLGLREIFTQSIEAERAQVRLGAVLKSTGYSAGLTAKQIDEMARSLSEVTNFDDDALKAGMVSLLRFRDVQGDTFESAAKAATDLAVAMDTDLASAFQTIGRLATNPTESLKALKGAGFALTESQIALAKSFEDAGDHAGAAKVAIDELEKSIGGAAQGEASGLYGGTRSVGKAWDDMLKAIGRSPLVTGAAVGAMSEMVAVLKQLDDAAQHGSWREALRAVGFAPIQGHPLEGIWKDQPKQEASGKITGAGTAEAMAAAAGRKRREDERFVDDFLAEDSKALDATRKQRAEEAKRAASAGEAAAKAMAKRVADDRIRHADELQAAYEDLQRMQEVGATNYNRSAFEEEDQRIVKETRDLQELIEERRRYDEMVKTGDENYYGITASEEEQQRMAKERRDMEDGLKAINEQGKSGVETMRELGVTFQSAFEDAIVSGKSFSDVLKGIEKDVLRIAARKLVTEPLGNVASDVFSGIGGWLKGIFGSAEGNVMTAAGPVALQRYAGGGIARRPTLSLFGEGSTPEAYVPLPDGRSIPVTMRGGGAGNVAVSISIDARGASSSSGDDAGGWAQMARRIEAGVKQILIAESRPGGLLAR